MRVVLAFYAALNARDVAAAAACLDESVRYDVFIFALPFVGRAAVQAHFSRVLNLLPRTLMFVPEDVAGDDTGAGLMWRVELDGKALPFGRGASFYRLSDFSGLILAARDAPEQPLKAGGLLLGILSLVASARKLLRREQPK